MAQIRTIAATVQGNRLLVVGMDADRLARLGATATAAAAALGEQRDRPVEPDGQHVVVGAERFVDRAVLEIGTEAADAGGDRLAALGVAADLARQRQQRQTPGEVELRRRQPARQRGALGLLLVLAVTGRFTELHIVAVRPLAQRHGQAAGGILAQ